MGALVFGPWSATPTYWASWDIYLGAMSPEEGSGICVLPLPSPPHTPTYQLLKSGGKSRSSLTPGQELDKVCGWATDGHLQKRTLGARSCPGLGTRWAWGQVLKICLEAQQIGDVFSLCCLSILTGNCFCPQRNPQLKMSVGGQRVMAMVGSEPLFPSMGQW